MDPVMETPIMTRSDAAHLLGLSRARLGSWSSGVSPLVHTRTVPGFHVTFPLVGIAEASLVKGLRHEFSMQRIRSFVDRAAERLDDPHPLLNPRLVTDGVDAYMDFMGEDGQLLRTRDQQLALRPVLDAHLKPLGLDEDGRLDSYRVHRFNSPVTVDPRFNGGSPSFTRNRVPLLGPAGYLAGGDAPKQVQADFSLTDEELRDVETHRDWILAFS